MLKVMKANTIRDSTSWKELRSTENLPAFLEAFAGENEKLDQAPKKCGSPHTIIVAGAGLRAADLVRYDEPAKLSISGRVLGPSRELTMVCRAVRKFQKKGCSVAKLVSNHSPGSTAEMNAADRGLQFAKHFKVEEQVSFLQKTRTGIAVGTPQRLIDLIENGTATLPMPRATWKFILRLLTQSQMPCPSRT